MIKSHEKRHGVAHNPGLIKDIDEGPNASASGRRCAHSHLHQTNEAYELDIVEPMHQWILVVLAQRW